MPNTQINVQLTLDGKKIHPRKLSSEMQDAIADGWFEAGEDVVEAIREGGERQAAPVRWPFLTGQSKLGIGADQRGFFLDNQTTEPEIKWELHNQAASPVGSSNFYAPIIEEKRGVISNWLRREGRRKMVERVEEVIEDRLG